MQWKKHDFFQPLQQQRMTPDLRQIQRAALTCTTSGADKIFLGDAEGWVYVMSRSFKVARQKCYNNICSHMHLIRRNKLLVTIGDGAVMGKDGTVTRSPIGAEVKIWRLQDEEEAAAAEGSAAQPLQYHNKFKLFPDGSDLVITCFGITHDLRLLAAGTNNGTVILLKGHLQNRRHNDTIANQRLTQFGDSPVNHISFSVKPNRRAPNKDIVSMFVVTDQDTKSYFVDRGETILLGLGSKRALLTPKQQLIIARDEAVFFYSPEDPLNAYGFDGEKQAISWFKNNLVVASNPVDRVHEVNIYDLKHKYIAKTFILPRAASSKQTVRFIVVEWGSVILITSNNQLWELREKDMETKLDILFQKQLFPLAISLAKEGDGAEMCEIYRLYGDHLYDRGEYDKAAEQYKNTIGDMEPSYVIRKFLDAQRIHNLTSFLEELHKYRASTEHTTLLLNCYTKLKLENKLQKFIHEGEDRDGDNPVPSFNVVAAIRTLRTAKYIKEALYLAERYNKHRWFLKLTLEDLKEEGDDALDYGMVLNYIAHLPFEDAADAMKSYGKLLVGETKEAATAILKSLCTHYTPKTPTKPSEKRVAHSAILSSDPAPTTARCQPRDFLHCLVDFPAMLNGFLKAVTSAGAKETVDDPVVWNALLELNLREHHKLQMEIEDLAEMGGADGGGDKGGDKADPAVRANLLAEEKKEQLHLLSETIMQILMNPDAKYDKNSAVCMVQMMEFGQGQLHLYNELKMHNLVLQHYMDTGETMQIMREVKRRGDKDPNLWLQVLTYFAERAAKSRDGTDGEDHQRVQEILMAIGERNVLSPMLVIQTLSRVDTLQLSSVKNYLQKCLGAEQKAINKLDSKIKQYKESTENMRSEIHKLRTEPFVFNKQKCAMTELELRIPSVHFMNGKSYNKDQIGSEMCPTLRQERNKTESILNSLRRKATQREIFFKEVDGADDGFLAVAKYFGNGMFQQSMMAPAAARSAGASRGPPMRQKAMHNR